MNRLLGLFVTITGVVSGAFGQTPSVAPKPTALSSPAAGTTAATPTPPPPACVAPEFRQFDFWLGNWKVMNPQGVQVGTSEITRVSEGCAVREQWLSARGKGGTSINYYDAADQQWHQDWVGGDGTILHLHGGLKDGVMILSSETKGSKGPVTNKVSYTPLPYGKVKQEWVLSDDGGKTWRTTFLGIYEKL
jgi:hypothetical protein